MDEDGGVYTDERVWSPEAKIEIVSATYTAGAVTTEVARRYGVSAQRVYAWRHEAKAGRLKVPASGFSTVIVEGEDVFVDDRPALASEAGDCGDSLPAPCSSAGSIEVDLDGGVVRLPHDIPVDRLVAVMSGLRQVR